MTVLITWLSIIGLPASVVVGAGAAYVRCRIRGEVQTIETARVLEELRRQG